MIHALAIRPVAEQDLMEARDWYEGQRIGLGLEFLDALNKVFDRIREWPHMYAAEYRSVRRVGLGRFPYIVHYRIVEDVVEVIAVLHGNRDSKTWRSRA